MKVCKLNVQNRSVCITYCKLISFHMSNNLAIKEILAGYDLYYHCDYITPLYYTAALD